MNTKYIGTKIERYAFTVGNTIVLLLVAFCTLYPFWNTLAVSFNVATDTTRGGIIFWPRIFTLQNYRAVFSDGTIFHAFFISAARTAIQTITGVFFTSMLAFALSRKKFMFRRTFTMILLFSMYINAGLIPSYFLMRSLGLMNTFLVYVIPGIISAFNFIVIRTYMNSLPESIIESAQIDGCGDFKIFLQIILPLCLPVLATIALFVAVGSWNAWFDTMIYNSRNVKLHTLQYKLMEFLQSSQSQSKSAADIGAMGMSQNAVANMVTPVSIRAAITIIAAAPIIIVYPFLQRYFITGLNVGGVKE
ncbi:MAG: carbohydrate ABC transporter permease [Treponema sp.]|jgi:putative aldouronate transport system permease protein|nr:carbohydrate ABC transporter permease [Treponema sp.]